MKKRIPRADFVGRHFKLGASIEEIADGCLRHLGGGKFEPMKCGFGHAPKYPALDVEDALRRDMLRKARVVRIGKRRSR